MRFAKVYSFKQNKKKETFVYKTNYPLKSPIDNLSIKLRKRFISLAILFSMIKTYPTCILCRQTT